MAIKATTKCMCRSHLPYLVIQCPWSPDLTSQATGGGGGGVQGVTFNMMTLCSFHFSLALCSTLIASLPKSASIFLHQLPYYNPLQKPKAAEAAEILELKSKRRRSSAQGGEGVPYFVYHNLQVIPGRLVPQLVQRPQLRPHLLQLPQPLAKLRGDGSRASQPVQQAHLCALLPAHKPTALKSICFRIRSMTDRRRPFW